MWVDYQTYPFVLNNERLFRYFVEKQSIATVPIQIETPLTFSDAKRR